MTMAFKASCTRTKSSSPWSILIVLYPFITGLVAGAFILASLDRVFRVTP